MFTGADVDYALDDEHRAVWWGWVGASGEQDAIPLVRILAAGSDHTGFEFQFAHLSLQEYLFASQLVIVHETPFWAKPATQLNKFLNQNTFRIGGETLGRVLAANGVFDQPLKLTSPGLEALELLYGRMAPGTVEAVRFDLSDSTFETTSLTGVTRVLRGSAGSLLELKLDRCRNLHGSLGEVPADVWGSLTKLKTLSIEQCGGLDGASCAGRL